jgi:hypothetical protein
MKEKQKGYMERVLQPANVCGTLQEKLIITIGIEKIYVREVRLEDDH